MMTNLTPLWRGHDMINETLMPVAQPDGTVQDLPLLYHADSITRVTSATQDIEYTQGKDYTLHDGKLRLLPGTAIPVMSHADYYPAEDDGHVFQCTAGGYIRFYEGDYMHRHQIAVSYTHHDEWSMPIPADKSALLPRAMGLLKQGGHMNLLIFGDSICTGANASGVTGAPPYLKPFYELLVEGLNQRYPQCAIALSNTSVGGKDSAWGAETAVERGANMKPDLCVIGFGMNDGSAKVPPSAYIANTRAIMRTISAANPECEYVLIATTLANDEVKGFPGLQADYLKPLLALEGEGVCVADMTTMHQSLLSRKRFHDMTGNNVNHPGDFLTRAYAHTLLATLGVESGADA